MKNIAVIVLAAGKGTRLAQGLPSPKPKVLYEVGGKPLIVYTLDLLKKIGLENIILVVGHKGGEVQKTVGNDFKFAVQSKRLGTGHAARIGLKLIGSEVDHVMVINGDDSAFYKDSTINQVISTHLSNKCTITFVTLEPENNEGLGRIIRKNGKVVDIVEEKAATVEQKRIKEVNDGLYIFDRTWLEVNLPKIKKSAVGEYYIVDLIKMAVQQNTRIEAYKLSDPSEWKGVNTPEELYEADNLMQKRIKNAD